LLATLRAKADRSRAERTRLARDEALDEQLIALARRRDPVTGAPLPVQLFEFDPAAYGGDGVAVVSVGDLDTADNVGVIVPGMGTTVSSIATLGPSAARLYSAARTSAPAETDATVVWIGYDAPSGPRALAQVVTSERARRGGDELRADLRDIAAMRGARDPHLVVFAHSYGSTTMGYAGAGGALAPVVDSVVLLGSPGAGPVRTAGEFGARDGVYVAATHDDPITWLGGYPVGLGADPAAATFGAIRLAAESTAPLGTTHSRYFDEGSEALANFARVLTGEPGAVTVPGRATVDLPGPIDVRREPVGGR
ncbi:alpha/beta hydrolase, partial [Tsukamurella soli]|uniref:alpha/beta hydrolase n=1 Tax=Tsukamurella soli TaxID=644556 RepID=UPI0031E59641